MELGLGFPWSDVELEAWSAKLDTVLGPWCDLASRGHGWTGGLGLQGQGCAGLQGDRTRSSMKSHNLHTALG